MGSRLRIILSLAAIALFLTHAVASPAQQPSDTSSADAVSVAGHLGRGYEALKQDRYQEAADEFRAALALDHSLVLRAQFPLGVALFELHRPQDARRELEAVRQSIGDHPNILYYLGRIDVEDHNFAAAIRDLTKAAVKPPFPDTAYYLGFAYFRHGDIPAAEKWLNQAAKANTRDARIPYQLGLVYRKEGRESEAKQAFALSEKLRLNDDSQSKLRVECGQKLAAGLDAEAQSTCDKLYDANNAEKLTTLGTLYAQHGHFEAALKPLRRAAELAPQSPQMQYNLALTYFQMNKPEMARTPLAAALQRWPDLFPLNALYGAVLLRLGEDREAYGALHKAHELNPQDAETIDFLYATTLSLGEKAQSDHRYPGALRFFEEAARLRGNDPQAHKHLAEIYRITGDTEKQKVEQQESERLSQGRTVPRL